MGIIEVKPGAKLVTEEPEELELPPDASPLDFFYAVFRSSSQPMPRRMIAADKAAQFVHAKPASAVSFTVGFGSDLEARMERTGRRAVIDAPRALAKPDGEAS